MLEKDPWLLPEGIEDTLPQEAYYLEQLRRRILDCFDCWGYELVIPPMIDYLNSLLTGAGHDLELQIFKLTDQLSGELLGIRADMTPQVARIDTHHLKRPFPTRLCYEGTVLHAIGDPLEKTRSPRQIGAELYGHDGIDSDLEVILLMLEMLALSGLQAVHLDLGHVGIYRQLARQAGLNVEQEAELFSVLQRKANAELKQLLPTYSITEQYQQLFLQLPQLNGDVNVLAQARKLLANTGSVINQALNELMILAQQLLKRLPTLTLSFDLAELRGYHYHTGVVFAAFIPNLGREVARGGRYDNIGNSFGHGRPATGFSADLKLLASLTRADYSSALPTTIFAPADHDPELIEAIRDLRAQGRRVIQQLPQQSGGANELNCTHILKKHHQHWQIQPLT
ncbi:MAG: hypothetical protein RL637_1031 [Pseudomonadota bacterium]|jgi:ATP phosphoribosyltransferase regulatory subunit